MLSSARVCARRLLRTYEKSRFRCCCMPMHVAAALDLEKILALHLGNFFLLNNYTLHTKASRGNIVLLEVQCMLWNISIVIKFMAQYLKLNGVVYILCITLTLVASWLWQFEWVVHSIYYCQTGCWEHTVHNQTVRLEGLTAWYA